MLSNRGGELMEVGWFSEYYSQTPQMIVIEDIHS